MKVTYQQLLDLLNDNGNTGLVLYNGHPYEVSLGQDGSPHFTGEVWGWEETTVTSSHGDYPVEADQFIKNALAAVPSFPILSQYDFFRNQEDYLTEG